MKGRWASDGGAVAGGAARGGGYAGVPAGYIDRHVVGAFYSHLNNFFQLCYNSILIEDPEGNMVRSLHFTLL